MYQKIERSPEFYRLSDAKDCLKTKADAKKVELAELEVEFKKYLSDKDVICDNIEVENYLSRINELKRELESLWIAIELMLARLEVLLEKEKNIDYCPDKGLYGSSM